jgi:hypothetical protein
MMVGQWLSLVWVLFAAGRQDVCSTTLITTYPTVDLLENSPVNTLVSHLRVSESARSKMMLLNMMGFESEMFTIVNGSLCTASVIDREQLIDEKRCSDRFYCLVEIHILVDDGLAYWVIPVHVVE